MHAHPLRQFARYVAVGVLNTAVTLIVYHGLIAAGAHYRLASAIGYTLGGLTSYVANRAWTFAGHGGSHLHVGPRFLAVFGLGLATDLVLISLLVEGLGTAKLLAQLIVTPFVAVQGFVLSRSWAFRAPAPRPRSAAVGSAGEA